MTEYRATAYRPARWYDDDEPTFSFKILSTTHAEAWRAAEHILSTDYTAWKIQAVEHMSWEG